MRTPQGRSRNPCSSSDVLLEGHRGAGQDMSERKVLRLKITVKTSTITSTSMLSCLFEPLCVDSDMCNATTGSIINLLAKLLPVWSWMYKLQTTAKIWGSCSHHQTSHVSVANGCLRTKIHSSNVLFTFALRLFRPQRLEWALVRLSPTGWAWHATHTPQVSARC